MISSSTPTICSPFPTQPHLTILNKDMDVYLRRFHEKALDCCNLVEEEVLITSTSMKWSRNSRYCHSPLFRNWWNQRDEEMIQHINAKARPIQTYAVRPVSRKRLIVRALRNDKRSGPSSPKKSTFEKRNPGVSHFASFTYRCKEVYIALTSMGEGASHLPSSHSSIPFHN